MLSIYIHVNILLTGEKILTKVQYFADDGKYNSVLQT